MPSLRALRGESHRPEPALPGQADLRRQWGVHIRVVQEILGHTRVTTTERHTHVATLQMKDAGNRMDQGLWGPP
ncbi:hypothetical protein GCM10022224_057280 [Nonomuraea antimicrobica]|uniref:Phage integrase family protein n=1 Tax=Nonomuraea antimicrobica TaxID=561173 RepID=A0ABP7CDK9_9ACTN